MGIFVPTVLQIHASPSEDLLQENFSNFTAMSQYVGKVHLNKMSQKILFWAK